MKITVQHDDGAEVDVTEGVRLALSATVSLLYHDGERFDREEEEALIALDQATRFCDAGGLTAELVRQREEREAAERRHDQFARLRAQQEEDRRKAAAQLATEMREREPALVRGGWTDAQLVELHRMRNAGLA